MHIQLCTFSNTARIRLRMSGIPRSASVIARGQSGKAGHAIAVMLSGSTYLGSCKNNQIKVQLCLIINRTVNELKRAKINQTKKIRNS